MIEKIKKFFSGLIAIFDLLEPAIAAVFATLLFLAVPFYLIKNLYQRGQLLLASSLSFIVIASFGICIRDIKRKRWTLFSACVALSWVICFLAAGWFLMS